MYLSIAKSMTVFGVLACFGLLVIVALGGVALHTLEVTGPVYTQISDGKDLLADIEPPAEYVIEAYLEANLALHDPAHLSGYKTRLTRLHRAYNGRRTFWLKSRLPADIRTELTENSNAQVNLFWQELEGSLLPALGRGDTAGASQSMLAVARYYAAHRKILDDIEMKAFRMDSINEKDAKSELQQYTLLLYGGALFATCGLIAGLFAIRQRVVTPIGRMTRYMLALADGRYDLPVPFEGRRDEIGGMAQALGVFREAGIARGAAEAAADEQRRQVELARQENEAARAAAAEHEVRLVNTMIGEVLSDLAAGNLTSRVTTSIPEQYRGIAENLNAAVSKMQEAMTSISMNAVKVKSGTDEITQASDDLASRTGRQAATLEETAAALDRITAMARRTAEGANQAREVVVNAKEDADKSGVVVRDAVQAMSEIERSSQEISQIVGVIDEIAFLTNLLALNAGIEAARAGDAGRGFALIASEVRALAQRSATAAKEIKALISTSSLQVETGVALVARTGTALEKIAAEVGEINNLVAEITASSIEQSSTLVEVNRALNDLDQVTQQNAAMVEESTAASHSLAEQARALEQMTGKFDIGATAATERGEVTGQISLLPPRRSAAAGTRPNNLLRQPVEAVWESF